jgi:hypothetical protein
MATPHYATNPAKIKCYPNPATKVLNISIATEKPDIANVIVYNIFGNKVAKK